MKKLPLFFTLLLLLQGLFTEAKTTEPAVECPLPPPGWINATNITANSITIEWEANGGALWYRITRFDVTNGIGLPDIFVPGTTNTFTSTPHAPGTTILFGVSATRCDTQVSEKFGNEITAVYATTWIVVDDIVSFNASGILTGNTPIFSGALTDIYDKAISVVNAPEINPQVKITKIKVKFINDSGEMKHAEFLVWSQCSDAGSSAIRVKYWRKSLWSDSVTCTPLSGTTPSIIFQYQGAPFFTLYRPSFAGGIGQLKIRNNRATTIFYDQVVDEETNPCFVEGYGENGGGDDSNEAYAEALTAEDHAAPTTLNGTTGLNISPNPCSDGFSVNYNLEAESPVTMALFDHAGRQVKTIQLTTLDAGNYSTHIYADDLPAGIYQLSFQTNQVRLMTTLVKHR